jgi:hypothetical protein
MWTSVSASKIQTLHARSLECTERSPYAAEERPAHETGGGVEQLSGDGHRALHAAKHGMCTVKSGGLPV